MSNSNCPLGPGSAITVTRSHDGVTIEVPPAGAWKGSGGLMKDALVWNGLLTVVTGLVVWAFIRTGRPPNSVEGWIGLLLYLLLWLVGNGMLLHAMVMGKRRAALVVTNGSLMVIQTGVIRSKEKEWPPGGVSAVRVGRSVVSTPPPHQAWLLELQILDRNQRKFGLLTGRDTKELYWLAYELREALGHDSFADAEAHNDD